MAASSYRYILVELEADSFVYFSESNGDVIRRIGYTYEHFWATICKMVCPVLSDHCLSVLSVTLVYCGQTDGLGCHLVWR